MPRYNPAVIEPKWQKFWEENRTFVCPKLPKGRKLYVLDMFPYPSGDGLHVGHPEGYTATDIVCRFQRMKGASVMHPMGWDAFGLPAEQHAKKTGAHPHTTTEKNIATFRRQLKMLGFSYDWDRELATTDVGYFRWTQFIFLVLFDTWFDETQQRGRPIAELPIPENVTEEGQQAIDQYRDEHRLAYQLEAAVNWCPALGTVLANEEVVGGVSERGGHPVVRLPLRQWMLRITSYADRLENDLDSLDWPESIKLLQRNWIGRSTGAEVDFFIGTFLDADGTPARKEYEGWLVDRKIAGWPRKPDEEVLRIYTTRPDTLFGATYMVIAPEHSFVERLTLPEQAEAVRAYCEQSARKSDLDRTDLAKEKTGVFTGSYAINPINGEAIPIWVADYVLISYGTGAIMAVPAHDTRDFEFAKQFDLPIRAVVMPSQAWAVEHGKHIRLTEDIENLKQMLFDARAEGSVAASEIEDIYTDGFWTVERSGRQIQSFCVISPGSFDAAYAGEGFAVNSRDYDGQETPTFKKSIAEDLSAGGIGRAAVNYKLRDWLFSRQHFWGEPFPILHELDAAGKPTGHVRPLQPEDLPLDLPEKMTFDAKHSEPTPPLDKAPHDWLYVTLDGVRYKRETNTMPQWAGSCWYYLRFLDPKNSKALVDPQIEKAWMPVDLYVGGAEHAVLHLLYARFWHKVLFDRGYVHGAEPFQKLVNQGMILGEMEYHGYQSKYSGHPWVGADEVEIRESGGKIRAFLKGTDEEVDVVNLKVANVEKREGGYFEFQSGKRVNAYSFKMSKSRGNVANPDEVVREYGADSLRLYEMFMGPLEAVKPWSMDGVSGVRGFLDRVWRMILDDRAETVQVHAAVQAVEPTAEQNRMLHKTIKAVTADLEQMSFNTAIARMMEFTNFFLKAEVRPRVAMEKLVLLLSPLAPHIAEELWEALGHKTTLAYEAWPTFDEAAIRQDTIEVPVQIGGKLRGRIQVPAEADKAALETAARNHPKIAEFLAGKTVVKAIVVPGRMVNFVVK